jgi:hypothetical protein
MAKAKMTNNDLQSTTQKLYILGNMIHLFLCIFNMYDVDLLR